MSHEYAHPEYLKKTLIDGGETTSKTALDRSPFWSLGPRASAACEPSLIGEVDMERAFEQIVTSIHMDDDYHEAMTHHRGHNRVVERPFVPDLNSPTSSTTSRISFNNGVGTPVGGGGLRDSPSRRLSNIDPVVINSPIPLATKSFLDDDWLRDRVKHDRKMAQVAGGLVRSSSTPPLMYDPFMKRQTLPTAGAANIPPGDYICKLCNVSGHWLKDCDYYEPRNSNSNGKIGMTNGHVRTTSSSNTSTSTSSSSIFPSRNYQPPGNYVCRLCGVTGHWIERCVKFQPKYPIKSNNGVGEFRDGSGVSGGGITCPPPRNYTCNLCHQPGHWIQQCSEFTPMPGRKQLQQRPPFF